MSLECSECEHDARGPHAEDCSRYVPTCPTLCDEDCEVDCHEGHQVSYKRDHEPEDCPGKCDPVIPPLTRETLALKRIRLAGEGGDL